MYRETGLGEETLERLQVRERVLPMTMGGQEHPSTLNLPPSSFMAPSSDPDHLLLNTTAIFKAFEHTQQLAKYHPQGLETQMNSYSEKTTPSISLVLVM